MTVSLDGTKIAANASKHAAVSCERAGQTMARLELEVQQLLAKAGQADATPLQDGLSLPGEIGRRQERKAALARARARIEARARARYAVELIDAVTGESFPVGPGAHSPLDLPRSKTDPLYHRRWMLPEAPDESWQPGICG